MKKIFILIIISIFISGCEATYTMSIEEDFNEFTTLSTFNKDEFEAMKIYANNRPAFFDGGFAEEPDAGYKGNFYDDGTRFYDRKITDRIEYSYRFYGNYDLSYIANSSVNEFMFANRRMEDSNKYRYSLVASDFTGLFNSYRTLSKITINIKTKREVIHHNADSVKDNTYTWVITPGNATRSINLYFLSDKVFDKNDSDNEEYQNNKSNQQNNGSNINPNNNNSNKSSNSSNNKSNNTNKTKRTILIYLLIPLFFILLFVIIKFRETINRR